MTPGGGGDAGVVVSAGGAGSGTAGATGSAGAAGEGTGPAGSAGPSTGTTLLTFQPPTAISKVVSTLEPSL
jgi:hypothetical protein